MMFDVDLVQALPVSCHGPTSVQAVHGEEAGVISEVMEETDHGLRQDGDRDHRATPLVKIGEKWLIRGHGG